MTPAMLRSWLDKIDPLTGSDREREILKLCIPARNPPVWPSWLDQFLSWPRVVVGSKDGATTITFCVAPDYFAVGDESMWFYLPMRAGTAQAIGDSQGWTLPTKHMVDLILETPGVTRLHAYSQRGNRESTLQFRAQNAKILKEFSERDLAGGAFVAGHAKDLVLSSKLPDGRTKVAIYGWHGSKGKAIQDLNAVSHTADYVDYSHKWRPVLRQCFVNGTPRDIEDVWNDPKLALLLVGDDLKDGVLSVRRYENLLAKP